MRNGRHKILTLGCKREPAARKPVYRHQAHRNDYQKNQAAEQHREPRRIGSRAGIHLERNLLVWGRQLPVGTQLVMLVILANGQQHLVFVNKLNGIWELGVSHLLLLRHVVQVNALVDHKTLHNRQHTNVYRAEKHHVVGSHPDFQVRDIHVGIASVKNRNVGRNGRVVLRRFRHIGQRFFFGSQFHAGRNLQIGNLVVQLVNRLGGVECLDCAFGEPVLNIQHIKQVLDQVARLLALFLVVEREVIPHRLADTRAGVRIERRQEFATVRNLKMPYESLAALPIQRVEITIGTA